MSNLSLSTFTNSEFGSVRTIIEDDKPLFCGADIATILGYTNPRKAINDHCRYVTKRDAPHPQNPTKDISMSFIPEGDVYRLIVRSKLPSAERFEKWLMDEVLPQIRKTGGYIPVAEEDDDLTIVCKALKITTNTLAQKEELISQLMPKAEAYDCFMNTSGYQSFGKVAKTLGVGRNKMLKTLRNRSVLFKDNGENVPYQKYIDAGYFIVRQVTGRDGLNHVTTRCSSKGVEFIRRQLLKSRKNCSDKTNSAEVA
jgi:anti-repressor protein